MTPSDILAVRRLLATLERAGCDVARLRKRVGRIVRMQRRRP